VVEDAASIAEIICRYAVFENVYIQSISIGDDELERALVQFYAAILVYLSKAKNYFQENSASGCVCVSASDYQLIRMDRTHYKKWAPSQIRPRVGLPRHYQSARNS
jgi:hypothetical protein